MQTSYQAEAHYKRWNYLKVKKSRARGDKEMQAEIHRQLEEHDRTRALYQAFYSKKWAEEKKARKEKRPGNPTGDVPSENTVSASILLTHSLVQTQAIS